MSEIRYDKLHDTHVIVAPERLHRPDCGIEEKDGTADEHCPFCEGHESMTPPEIYAMRPADTFANEPGWQTRVVPNLYKAVQIEAPYTHHYGLNEYWDGFGAHEVLIDTPKHHTSMREWDENEIANWLKTLRSRVADLRRDERIAYLSLFKNEGRQSGSTQAHSHTQIIGLPIIPKAAADRFHRDYEHYKATGISLMESLLHQEENSAERIVEQRGDFTAFCPYASAYPFETIISSKKAIGQIDTLSDDVIVELAPLIRSVLKKLKRQLGCHHFNLCITTPPLQKGSVPDELFLHSDQTSRFAIRIMPCIYRQGGFEASTGVIINPVAPEKAAKLLRESRDV